jgi:hypothetical protein
MRLKIILFLLFLFLAGNLFSQGILNEFVIEKDDNPEVFYKSKGCTPDDGVIVFYTTIPNLKFSMPDTPSRLKNTPVFDKTNNCYVLCVQPNDNEIGGITKYSIDITAEGYKRGIVEDIKVQVNNTQSFTINPKIDQNSGVRQGHKVAVQRFSNETAYAKGFFYDKENDPIGKQATTVLSTKLASINKFILLEWNENQKDWQIADYKKQGIDYLIAGSITEFGRNNVSVKKKKYQIAQATISIRLIDIATGQIVYAEEAKGEAKTDGKTMDYDPKLGDKAISDAISKLVENINKIKL